MEYAHWWGPHWHWFWIVPFLFMIMMIVCASRMIRRAREWRRDPGHPRGWMPPGWCKPGHESMPCWWTETPGRILDRRYTRGDITKEQYEQMKRDIESSRLQTGLATGRRESP
jgi:putative membrane protein